MKHNPSKKSDTFTATQVGVLVEELRSEFRVFGESQDLTNSKLDATMAMVARNTEDIFVIKADIRVMKNDITDIKTTLGSHDGRLSRLELAVLK